MLFSLNIYSKILLKYLFQFQAAKRAGKDVNVKAVMDTWMKQMNYPLVIIQRNADGQFQFVQKHYLEPQDAKSPKNPSPYK